MTAARPPQVDREWALGLVHKYCDKDITVRHLISVEGVMRALARHFGEDEHRWGLVGLWHDLDYDRVEEDLERHTKLTLQWLSEEGYDDYQVLNAIRAHLHDEFQTDLMSKAIVHADGVADVVAGCGPGRPEKGSGEKALCW